MTAKDERRTKRQEERRKRKKKKKREEEIVKAQMEKSVRRRQVRGESGRAGGKEGRKEGESLSVSAKRGRQTEFPDDIPAQPEIGFCNFVKKT